jgi:dihydrodipicolinate synthase/N-acetylneuraminate lyase
LYRPVLELVSEELARDSRQMVRIAGVVGETALAVKEARTARELDYDAVLLSVGALRNATEEELINHCKAVANEMALVGFYLQPRAGGRLLSYGFWRRFAEIENVVAIKIAPFNRYQTIDVVRAVADAGRDDIALYTGNDDNIVVDLLTPFRFGGKDFRIVGGLLGHWAVWTKRAVELLDEMHALVRANAPIPQSLLQRAIEITDANAAFFDAANGYAGCIPGIHKVLRRQGLLAGTWCLDPNEKLSPGQSEEIDRVYAAYPHLNDDAFVAEHLEEWLDG